MPEVAAEATGIKAQLAEITPKSCLLTHFFARIKKKPAPLLFDKAPALELWT